MYNRIFCFLIFALFLFITCSSFKKDFVMCGDCTEQNKFECTIESESGYYVWLTWKCAFLATWKLMVLRPAAVIHNEPNNFFNSRRWRFSIYMSPELGCQIQKPKDDEGIGCRICYMIVRVRDASQK